VDAVESGGGALERLLDELGPQARVVRSSSELAAAAP
jgi:hypothetical protein